MSYPLGSIPFSGIVGTSGSTDTYAVTTDELNLGGYRSVVSTTVRDAITVPRRRFGMMVTVSPALSATSTTYVLTDVAGTGDLSLNGTNWVVFSSGSSGTVTSVGLSLPSIFTVSGSPVTSSGTLTAVLATQTANYVLAGPTTGSAAAPTFRALVSGDIPDISATYQLLSQKGAANGYAPLDSSGKISVSYLPSVLMEYQGSWNPNTNTPTISDATGTNGYVYWVSAAKATAVSGLTDPSMVNFQIGDLIIYSASVGKWQLTTPAAGVSSVNGAQGAVVLTTDNISQGTTNLYYTDAHVYSAISTAWSPAAGTIAIGDTLQTILQKLQGNISSSFSGNFSPATTSTVTVGGLAAGQSLGTGALTSINEILTTMLAPYIAPTFTSFSMSGQSTSVECGATVSGTKSFTFSFSNSANVTAGTLSVYDVTASTTLASSQSITSPVSVAVGSITNSAPATHSWNASAINNASTPVTFYSGNFTVSWYWRVYYGTNTSVTLAASTDVTSLSSSGLASGFSGTYSFAAGGYKYFCWPDTFGSPSATSGFKDTSNGLPMAMATSTDNAAYSNVQNGWYYATLSVSNLAYSVSTTYRIYRTQNILGSAYNIQVS